ncbi:hypothetical protein [Flectobacillus roseus]|uniref:hypothetical protein n=1 Tax=Flectobacillus roseus TaxID=502259 RepID=UPI0024B7EC97|nr:hypothetical protein [Flectobacillus roseus]MDI9869809.1 hypothetical protein [Flectobacillus roseus]
MKTWIYALALILTANLAAEAQNTWTSDPGYSTHNYKHPNKAAAAKKQAEKNHNTAFVVVGKTSRDYKKFADEATERKLLLEYGKTPEELANVKNYKMPHTNTTNSASVEKEIAVKAERVDKN